MDNRILRRRARDWILGGLIFLALICWVQYRIGWNTLLMPWSRFTLLQLLYLFSLSALSYVLRAVRIFDYFHAALRGRFAATLRLSILHNCANNLLPMRAGEAVFPVLMKRYFGQELVHSTLSLLWIRLLDLHCLVLVALLAVGFRYPGYWGPLAVAFWLLALPLAHRAAIWSKRPLGQGRGRLHRLCLRLLIALPEDRARFFRIYLWTALSWGSKFLAFAIVLRHFIPVELWTALAGIIGAELSSVLPVHGIAGTGSYELAAMAVLVPLGIDAETALAGAVNLHLFLLGVTLTLALLSLMLPTARREFGSA